MRPRPGHNVRVQAPCVGFSEWHINVLDILRIVLLFLSVSDILKIVSLLLTCVGFERCVAVSAVLYPPNGAAGTDLDLG